MAERGKNGAPEDYLFKAMGRGATVRAIAVRCTGVVRDIANRHGTLPTAGAALSHLVTAALLMGGTLKGREQLSLQIKGAGPIGELMAIADAHGSVRATIQNPFIDLPPRDDGKFDVATAIGTGNLLVTKSLGLKDPYQSIVPMVSGQIATDLAHYYLTSEQKPAAVGLGEVIDSDGIKAAGGFLVQAFPGADDEELEAIESAIAQLPPVSQLIAEGGTPEAILDELIPDMMPLVSYPVQRVCNCSRDRMEQALIALGAKELKSLMDEQETTELKCHFCTEIYAFSSEELGELLTEG